MERETSPHFTSKRKKYSHKGLFPGLKESGITVYLDHYFLSHYPYLPDLFKKIQWKRISVNRISRFKASNSKRK